MNNPLIYRSVKGEILSEIWSKNPNDTKHSDLHRLDGPAHIGYYSSGEIHNEEWVIEGITHRLEGPAYITYYKNGRIKRKEWVVHNRWHNLVEPAIVVYREDGSVKFEQWATNGLMHREVYPAEIYYSSNGDVERTYYHNRGDNITDQVKEYLNEHDLRDPFDIPVEHSIIMKMKFW